MQRELDAHMLYRRCPICLDFLDSLKGLLRIQHIDYVPTLPTHFCLQSVYPFEVEQMMS